MASLEGIEKSVFSADGGPMRNVMLELSQEYVRKGQFISALAWNMALLSFYEACVYEHRTRVAVAHIHTFPDNYFLFLRRILKSCN